MNCKFSIHGYGYFVKVYNANNELYKYLEPVTDTELYNATFNAVESDQLTNKPFYLSYTPDETYCFYKIDQWSRLEIHRRRKKIRINFIDLLATQMLFEYPFVNHENDLQVLPNTIVICEEDMGNFGQSIVKAEKFDIDQLEISIAYIHLIKQTLVIEIKYNQEVLIFKKADTLNRSMMVYRNY